jgi:hypothetical protein
MGETIAVLAFSGPKRAGKSELARMISEKLNIERGRVADVEFSDPIIEATNSAATEARELVEDPRAYEKFRNYMVKHATQLVGEDEKSAPSAEAMHTHERRADQDCPECDMKNWYDETRAGTELSRENKAEHRAPLVWLGVALRDTHGPRVWGEEVGRRVERAMEAGSKLVTVGGVRSPEDVAAIGEHSNLFVVKVIRGEDADRDATNQRRHQIKPDCVVHNKGTLEDLEIIAGLMADDLVGGGLKPEYGV